MVPNRTSIEDIQKLVSYMIKQVGWIELAKVEKALGKSATHHRKVGTMAALGLVERDNSNVKLTERGQKFAENQQGALRGSIRDFDLYRATAEWVYYQGLNEVTATSIGQYWDGSHAETLEGLKGETLKDGAVCFSRIMAGAGLGDYVTGRGGKQTRLEIDRNALQDFVDGKEPNSAAEQNSEEASKDDAELSESSTEDVHEQSLSPETPTPPASEPQKVSVSTSPNVHVNLEIHIAADATAETVREIFRNMAKYVLDKPVNDDE